MKPLQPATGYLDPEKRREITEYGLRRGMSIEEIEEVFLSASQTPLYMNDVYQVAASDTGDFIHLSIKRLDRAPIHDWRDLQEIKNQIVGPEHEGLELYPAESRVVDTANQYHLWVLKDPRARVPFGFTPDEAWKTEESAGGSQQRPFAEGGDNEA